MESFAVLFLQWDLQEEKNLEPLLNDISQFVNSVFSGNVFPFEVQQNGSLKPRLQT